MSRLAKLSLANRSLVALASIAIVLFGVVATGSLKQELIPSLQLPMAVTMTSYPGASPDIVERDVTEPIESAISGVDGLDSTTSTSSNGMSVVTSEFTYGTDIDKAVQDLQESVNRISADLPDDAEPTVQAGNFDDFPVVVLAASSDQAQRELAAELEDTAVPELRAITGVRDVEVAGARTEQVTVDVDEDELAAKGLTIDAITNALQANGISVPGGNLTNNGETFPVEIGEQFRSTREIRDLALLPMSGAATVPSGTSTDGTVPPTDGTVPPTDTGTTGEVQTDTPAAAPEPVKLSEVASVRETVAPETTISRTNGKPSISVAITKTQDGNTVSVSDGVKDAIAGLERKIGHNAELTIVWNQAPYIEDSIEGLTTEGLLGLAFAVLVIMIFLLSLRTTIVTAVSIPMSLLVAMIGLYAGGYSLNILTLGALTVAVGRVVDDSIVVLENIKRHIGYGEEKVHAILTAVREVAGAITASTVTTAGVFLPIAFVGGQTGELFRPFGITVAIALLASLLVALTIIPVLAYWFVKPRTVAPEEQAEAREAALEKERRNPLQRTYVPVIRWTTKHRIVTLLIGVLVFAGTVGLAPLVQTNFLDSSGETTLSVTQKLPPGSSLGRTDEAAAQVEDVLEDMDRVETYQVTIGSTQNAFFGPAGTNQAQIDVTAEAETDMTAFEKRLREQLDGLDDAGEISIGAAGGGPGSSNVEVLVESNDSSTLEEAANRIERAVENTDGTTDVTNNLADEQPSVSVTVDREKAAAFGLSEAQVGQAVRDAFEGVQAGSVVRGDQTLDVLVRVGDQPASTESIEKLSIATPLGQSVPLSDVADVERVSERAEITHTDGERTASVTAKPTDASDLGALTTDLTERLDKVDLPAGATYTVGGVSQEQTDAFAQLGLAMLAAIAIVFLVMVATFRSIVQPLILLVSVPFAATGAIGLLLLTDTALGVPALIGMLMLVGIVVTNAIVLIDLINQYREQGKSVRDAVIEGGRQRLRPVLMTALATICALTPMAFGLTGGGVFISQPLAIVVIGGLVSSTLLTLVLVPTLYTMVESVKERRQAKRERRPGHNGVVEPAAPVTEPAVAVAPEPAPAGGTTVVTPGEPARITVEVVVRNEQNGARGGTD